MTADKRNGLSSEVVLPKSFTLQQFHQLWMMHQYQVHQMHPFELQQQVPEMKNEIEQVSSRWNLTQSQLAWAEGGYKPGVHYS